MYEMKPEYDTDIPFVDEEHKKLFAYANEAYELLHDEFIPDKYDRIVAILTELRDYTKQHFSHEEAYMESIQYKRIFTQKIQHQEFIDKLDSIDMESIDAGEDQDGAIGDILTFLTDWLVHHILELDTLIGK